MEYRRLGHTGLEVCRLCPDWIDAYPWHRHGKDIPMDEVLSALHDCVRQGAPAPADSRPSNSGHAPGALVAPGTRA